MKLRQLILITLVTTAIGAIVLPMQVEMPLFKIKPVHIDNHMFEQPLINTKQTFSMDSVRTAVHLSPAKPAAVDVPEAWVLAMRAVNSEQAAVKQTKALVARGLPAFYTPLTSHGYQVMVGPEVDKPELIKLQRDMAANGLTFAIMRYQPT